MAVIKINSTRSAIKVSLSDDFHEFVNRSLAMNILNIRRVLFVQFV